MLSFRDHSTSVKVFRVVNDAEGHVVRERLGVVKKKDFSLDEQLQALPAADKSSIDKMISFYNDSAKYETLAAIYSLPTTLRKIVDHVVAEGSDFEREMVMMSVLEALRVLRKADREQD